MRNSSTDRYAINIVMLVIVAGTMTVIVIVLVIKMIVMTILILNTDSSTLMLVHIVMVADKQHLNEYFVCWWSHANSGSMGGCFASTAKTA